MTRTSILIALAVTVACGGGPLQDDQPAETGSIYLISQKASKAIGWYTAEGELLGEAPVSDHPHEIVMSPDGERLYVTDNGVMQIEFAGEGGNKVSIVDVPGRKRVGEVDLGEYRRPHGIALCPDGTLLATSEAPDQLLIIDTESQSVVRTFDTGGETPHIVKCSADSTQAYVSNARSRTVARIDIETGERELLETGDRPEGSCFSPDRSVLYVVHRDGDKVVAIDTDEWRVTGEIETPGQPVRCGVTSDGLMMAYGLFEGSAIGFADLEGMVEVGRVSTVGPTVSLEMDEDGETAFACAQDQNTCYAASVSERAITHTIHLPEGSGPDPMLMLH